MYKSKRISKKKIDELTKEIDSEFVKFIKDGKYKEVLMSLGNLNRYSLNNQLYILMQNYAARTVYGIRKWNKLNRHINKGEKAIKVFSPIIKKVENEDEDGVIETKYEISGYKLSFVFDITQTNGKDLDVFKFDVNKVVIYKDRIINTLTNIINSYGFSVRYSNIVELGESCYGLCNHKTNTILIRDDLSDLQEISTLVHECGHALAHSKPREDFLGLTKEEKREIKEVEAESIACIVCSYLDLETKNYNFSYISAWSNGDISKFRKNLQQVSFYANILINGLEKEFNSYSEEENAKFCEE